MTENNIELNVSPIDACMCGEEWPEGDINCVMKAMGLKFSSGNSVSVERSTILDSEYQTIKTELERLRAENELLKSALSYVKETIEESDEWWMNCPDRGGFDLDLIDKALG